MIGSLEGRIALVTGCTGGIGKETSRALGAAGATVIGADLPEDGGDWNEGIGSCAYHRLDVTDEASWQQVLAAVERDHGKLDILVHIAGIVVVEKLENTSLEQWRKQMAVNVDGVFLGTKAAIPLMSRSGQQLPHGASIVVISSVAGLIGSPLHTGYCASKGAVRLFAKACAMEFSALGYKVRFNSVHPSGVKTGMVDHILQRFVDNGFAESVEQAAEGLAPAHPIGRMAEPIDIAKAVRFLASDESGYMHGSELVVDGGYTAQ
ncbi:MULTISPECIES: SDR family oxidoreductase [Novosphingobium]|uniref:NAD(P)-dependent dehydrogenase, short-chain alcohol dehydrogenase family n=1 Tax=Novosphingobium mathurense TaxID=428990 RepID=A0A1U6HVY9_9SPHN|nr:MULTISPECIES: SDR family oxidoreductase [Novosphingobium]CDO35194.1 Short-chain dehydrogenase/reductase SDR [Novosphingobium sp. KN65.2]SLJ99854.1 NAD(P)-dependent dehydrogenase, short-chain alcohol dehydrogenase family [Novosphingobium mathurense]